MLEAAKKLGWKCSPISINTKGCGEDDSKDTAKDCTKCQFGWYGDILLFDAGKSFFFISPFSLVLAATNNPCLPHSWALRWNQVTHV
jgi:hypothetical protein